MDTKYLCYKVFKQFIFSGLWFSLGLAFGVTGPCLPDLMQQLELNYEEISRALTCVSLGFFLGSLIGGVLFSLFYKHGDLLTTFSTLSCTLGLLMVPWSRSLWQLGICFTLVGISGGCNNSGVNTLVLHLWGDKSGPPMFLMHLGFGIGGLVAPQIARPFISDATQTSATIHSNSSLETSSPDTRAPTAVHGENTTTQGPDKHTGGDLFNPGLFYPYTIIAMINASYAFAMLVFYIKGPPKGFPISHKKTPLKQLFSPKTCASNHPGYAVTLLVLLFLMFMQAVGAEIVYGNFIYSYSIEAEVAFDKDRAATLTSLFWFAHMAGRFVGAILEICIPTSIILFCDYVLLIITTVLLALLGYHNATALWLLTGCFGFLISPLYPAGMVWTNLHLEVNSMSTMILVIGSSAGLSIYVYIAGYMLEYFGPKSVMYFLVFCAIGLMLVYIILTLIGRKYLQIKRKEQQICKDSQDITESMALSVNSPEQDTKQYEQN